MTGSEAEGVQWMARGRAMSDMDRRNAFAARKGMRGTALQGSRHYEGVAGDRDNREYREEREYNKRSRGYDRGNRGSNKGFRDRDRGYREEKGYNRRERGGFRGRAGREEREYNKRSRGYNRDDRDYRDNSNSVGQDYQTSSFSEGIEMDSSSGTINVNVILTSDAQKTGNDIAKAVVPQIERIFSTIGSDIVDGIKFKY